jgi:hypothetical protein
MGGITKITAGTEKETKENIEELKSTPSARIQSRGDEKRGGSIGREGGGHELSENPDQIIKATVKSCLGCGQAIAFPFQLNA